jgi:hypothetical protein
MISSPNKMHGQNMEGRSIRLEIFAIHAKIIYRMLRPSKTGIWIFIAEPSFPPDSNMPSGFELVHQN